MRYWIQFLTTDRLGNVVDALASDGVCNVDGRLSQENMAREAKLQAWRLQPIKQFVGFQIVAGESYTRERMRSHIYKLEYPINAAI